MMKKRSLFPGSTWSPPEDVNSGRRGASEGHRPPTRGEKAPMIRALRRIESRTLSAEALQPWDLPAFRKVLRSRRGRWTPDPGQETGPSAAPRSPR